MEWPADELERFKREIDLRAYAESQGYELDKSESWKGAFVMRRGDDKVKIALHHDGHWIYASYRDPTDNGTIIDFVQWRRGCNLVQSRIELRNWIGVTGSWNAASAEKKLLEPLAKDIEKVRRAWAVMVPVPPHPYLEQRCIPPAVLSCKRFRGCVRMARNGAAAFPHFDGDGLCGMEFRGPEVKRFIAGGRKALWTSNKFSGDDALIFCESAIEALSHAVLHPDPDDRIRYASTAGGFGEGHQWEVIAAAILDVPDDSDIVVSMNADAAGGQHASKIRDIFNRLPARDRRFVEHYPQGAKDWNDALCGRSTIRTGRNNHEPLP
jgi:hypothetical protein